VNGKPTEYQVVAKYADQVVGSRVSTEFRQYGDPPEFSTSVLPNFRRNWHSIPRSSSKFRIEDFSWNFYGMNEMNINMDTGIQHKQNIKQKHEHRHEKGRGHEHGHGWT
jgi:hypothetical protein